MNDIPLALASNTRRRTKLEERAVPHCAAFVLVVAELCRGRRTRTGGNVVAVCWWKGKRHTHKTSMCKFTKQRKQKKKKPNREKKGKLWTVPAKKQSLAAKMRKTSQFRWPNAFLLWFQQKQQPHPLCVAATCSIAKQDHTTIRSRTHTHTHTQELSTPLPSDH